MKAFFEILEAVFIFAIFMIFGKGLSEILDNTPDEESY